MPDFPQLELLLYWVLERESVRLAREAGDPPPWSSDPIFQRERFCHVERENDAVTKWIRQHWREPYRDNADIWFLMAIARLGGNDPKILAELTPPLPWDRGRYLDEMRVKGLKVGVRGYRSIIGDKGVATHEHLARNVFDPLWASRAQIRPRDGGTCRSFFDKLSAFSGLGGSGFLAAQIVADVKFTPLLANASDFWDFCSPGPGSQRGLNVVCGRDFDAPWSEERWRATFNELRAVAGPQIEEMLGRRLSASDAQSCLCELSKYFRAKTTGRIARPFKLGGGQAQRPPTRRRCEPASAPIETPTPSPVCVEPAPFARTLFTRLVAPFINKTN
jgi:hypothetical protein